MPCSVVAAEVKGAADPQLLYPQEAEQLGQAVEKRIEEFTAGRLCARRALAQLGIDQFPLCVADDRRPLWPDAVVGSITHTRGFRAAVAAYRSDISAVGIDAELIEELTPELWPQIAIEPEQNWLSQLPLSEQPACAALLFSAKEAFYKCQYELTRQWLDFYDVSLDLSSLAFPKQSFDHPDFMPGTFELQILKKPFGPLSQNQFKGYFVFDGQRVITAISLPA